MDDLFLCDGDPDSFDHESLPTIEWEKLPPAPSERHVNSRIPRSLWIPFHGAYTLVSLLNEAWRCFAPGKLVSAKRILEICGQVDNITMGDGGLRAYLDNVRDELFSHHTWTLAFLDERPRFTRSYHDGIVDLAEDFLGAVSLTAWNKWRDLLLEGRDVPFYDLTVIDIPTMEKILLEKPVSILRLNCPKDWDARFVRTQLV